MTDETSSEDRISQLETRIEQLEQTISVLSARGSGISHVFGRNPLMEKYASLGSQAFATLKAGQVFDDTLGKFFPLVVSKEGEVTINSSFNVPNTFTFHDTSNSTVQDFHLGLASGVTQLAFFPSADEQLILNLLNNTSAATTRYLSFFVPSAASGTSSPRIEIQDAAGVRFIYAGTHVMKAKAGI